MTGTFELATYRSGVPATGCHCGAPSNTGVNVGPSTRDTAAVCGIEFAITASCACGVPATDASTIEAGEPFAGICLNDGGSALLATNVHGPLSPARGTSGPPSARSRRCCVVSTITSVALLVAHSSGVPVIGTRFGWPLKTISSVGTSVT